MPIKATQHTDQQYWSYIYSQVDHLLIVAYLYARYCEKTQEFAEIRGPGAWLTCGTTYPKVALLRDRASFQSQVLVPQTFHSWTKVLVVRTDATLHYVHFVKYDDAVSFDDAVSDTIRRRGGNRGIFTEEGVDTVAYFGGNHGSRV